MIKDTSGPAFPCEWDYIDSNREAANGMSLRDYFAAKAMQGMLATGRGGQLEEFATLAYREADALLRARKQ